MVVFSGTVEQMLRVALNAADIGADEPTVMDADAHRWAFLIFLTQLFHQFDRYMQQLDADVVCNLAGIAWPWYMPSTKNDWRRLRR